jgi:hypothetical protein
MLVVLLLAAVAAPIPRPLEVAVYHNCTWAIQSNAQYCPALVPTNTKPLCCGATLKATGVTVRVKITLALTLRWLTLQQCAASALADVCPFLVTIKADGADDSWCCNFADADGLREHISYIYPWGDDDFRDGGVAGR